MTCAGLARDRRLLLKAMLMVSLAILFVRGVVRGERVATPARSSDSQDPFNQLLRLRRDEEEEVARPHHSPHHQCMHDNDDLLRTGPGHHGRDVFAPQSYVLPSTAAPRLSTAGDGPGDTAARMTFVYGGDGVGVVGYGGLSQSGFSPAAAPHIVPITVPDSDAHRVVGDAAVTASSSSTFVHHHHTFKPLAVGPLRFTLSYLDILNPAKICSAPGQVVPNFQGSTATCLAGEEFTVAKRDVLLTQVLPAAFNKILPALYVNQVQGNLTVPVGACPGFDIPADHFTTGVVNSDFVLYLAAAPAPTNVMGWASYCAFDQSARPVVGRANFSPLFIKWSATNTDENDVLVNMVAHEIMHAFGFDNTYMTNFWKGSAANNPQILMTKRDKTVRLLASPYVVAAARAYFGCPTLEGMELEDEGNSGSQWSHWDRRNSLQDTMSPVCATHLSTMSLSYFIDTGVYAVDLAKASKKMKWGANAGCSFFTDKCNTTSGGLGTFFCNDMSGAFACNVGNLAAGQCCIGDYPANTSIPSYFRYFPGNDLRGAVQSFVDYCPFVQASSSLLCNNPLSRKPSDDVLGMYYGNQGRCVSSTAILSGQSTSAQVRCHRLRCWNGTRVQVQVPPSVLWIDCPSDGSVGTVAPPAGFVGVVTCPAAASICDDELFYLPTTTATNTDTTNSRASPCGP